VIASEIPLAAIAIESRRRRELCRRPQPSRACDESRRRRGRRRILRIRGGTNWLDRTSCSAGRSRRSETIRETR